MKNDYDFNFNSVASRQILIEDIKKIIRKKGDGKFNIDEFSEIYLSLLFYSDIDSIISMEYSSSEKDIIQTLRYDSYEKVTLKQN